MKIVILDGYTINPGDMSWDTIAAFGELTVYERTAKEQIIPRIADADIVFTNKTQIQKCHIDAAKKMKYICVLATGYNVVDVAYAKEKGIPVSNIPAYSTNTVAQNVFALILHICHHVAEHSASVHALKWSNCPDFCYYDYPQMELFEKNMGIIGFGSIGRRVATLAQAFGMKVLVYTRSPKKELETESLSFVDLNTLYENSHIISLHCPLTPDTKEMINKESIKKMRDGAIIINTGRGPLIHEEDLAKALRSGKLYGAGLDVLSAEPPAPNNPLFQTKNCVITPHVSWSAKEARLRLLATATENLREYLKGNFIHCVNL